MNAFIPLTPKMKPLGAKKSQKVCVLDIGSSKIACLIADLKPISASESLPSRSHTVTVLGFGMSQSLGIKSGVVVHPDEAEKAIRKAVSDAEQEADLQAESIIVSIGAGKPLASSWRAEITLSSDRVEDKDIYRLMEAASGHGVEEGRSILHSLPSSYTLDNMNNIIEPRGMIGKTLGVDMHMVTVDTNIARNLMLLIERCHLNVEAVVSAPYASGLSVLTDDEIGIGTVCLDFGAGVTGISIFSGGHLIDVASVPIGGRHITTDISRGLSLSFEEAERLKVLHGGVIAIKSDERESFNVRRVGQEVNDLPVLVSRAQLIEIIRPRVDEILEMISLKLQTMRHDGESNKRLVVTGGGALLTGLSDLTGQFLKRQVRLSRPMGVFGLPSQAKSPVFATLTGLALYPQFAGHEHFEISANKNLNGYNGFFSKSWSWIKESF
jgi:cell division protein FtsA